MAGTDAYTYDNDDRVIAYTDPNSHTTSYGYDADGNLITVTDGNNNTTTYAYDSRNQVTTVTDALGNNTVYGYDLGGQPADGDRRLGAHDHDALRRPQPCHHDDQRGKWNHDNHL